MSTNYNYADAHPADNFLTLLNEEALRLSDLLALEHSRDGAPSHKTLNKAIKLQEVLTAYNGEALHPLFWVVENIQKDPARWGLEDGRTRDFYKYKHLLSWHQGVGVTNH
jgi:hypothetical protein